MIRCCPPRAWSVLALVPAVLAFAPAPPAALSDTLAWAQPRPGCAALAPPDSLVAQPTTPLTFLPNNDDLIVMEVETVGAIGDWAEETDLPGYGGASYFRWDGPDFFNQPGHDTLSFNFEIVNAGSYRVRIHNRHDDPDSSQENDCWVRMDGGAWDKFFENGGAPGVGVWHWQGVLESNHQKPLYTLSAGTHTFEISGRSNNFKIDRVHLFPGSTFGETIAHPESQVLRDTPVVGTAFSVEIDDPTDAKGLTPGVTFSAWYVGAPSVGAPCGPVLPDFGELLIALAPPPVQIGTTKPWSGPGIPTVHTGGIPANPSQVGTQLSTQGVFVTPSEFRAELTTALDLQFGNR